MPFPIEPDPRTSEPESDFLIQDPFGLRRAVTPFFAFDLQDGMLAEPRTGAAEGIGTSFYVTPFGHQLSAMHVTTDFLNARKASIRLGPEKTLLELKGTWIGIYHDPGLVYGMAKAGELLVANDFTLFPVDQTKKPSAIFSTADQLNYIEPSIDLTGWNICGLGDRKTTYLPIRVGCPASIAEGDRVLAVGYPSVRSWRRHPGAPMVTYQEEMRGSIGRVLKVDHAWDQERKIWPTITVDANWKGGMSGGPVFNENGEVVGIVSRGVDSGDDVRPWSSALWLEALPFREDIYGSIEPRNPGWIVGWGVCNAHSVAELFQTQQGAEDYVKKNNLPLTVRKISALHPKRFTRPDDPRTRKAAR